MLHRRSTNPKVPREDVMPVKGIYAKDISYHTTLQVGSKRLMLLTHARVRPINEALGHCLVIKRAISLAVSLASKRQFDDMAFPIRAITQKGN